MEPNWLRYLNSLSNELAAQSQRVRDLIGDSHWLVDGHHKEYLLIELLSRHLPTRYIASRGFVISPADPNKRSLEQDILIVDQNIEAPLFNQGGVVIAFPNAVRAAVSVKSTLGKKEVEDSVIGLNSVRALCKQPESVWTGAYFFEVGRCSK